MRFLNMGAALQLLLSGISAADVTSCWKIDSSTSTAKALAAYNGSACAVNVTISMMAASYAPNESVALVWGVQLDAESTNDIGVPMPLNAMATLSPDNRDTTVQILSTYVRTCTSRLQCMPSLLDDNTFTTAQSKDVLISTEATYFEALNDLCFEEEGNYTVAAVVVLGNSDNASLLYYFQTFADIIVKEAYVEAVKFDGGSTYCRVTAQNPLDDLLDADVLLASSESSEIEVVVDVNDVVQANQSFDVVWTATLTRNVSKEIQLPSPLEAICVGDAQKNHYTVVSSFVKMCERDMGCDEYSRTVTVTSAQLSANFTSANTMTFNVSRIVVPSTGWYTGFAQVTLVGNDADSQRYDFIKYFEVFVTKENVAWQMESEKHADDGSESYCWGVGAGADDKSVDANSVIFSGNSTNCPYTMNVTASTTTFSVDAGVLVNWTVARQTAYIDTDEVTVNSTTIYDELTDEYVNLPQVNIYYCNDTKCSPFSQNKTLVYSAPATNFSAVSGMALFSSKIKIPSEGTYALMVHSVIPNGDDFRFDVASFIGMNVTAPSTLASTEDDSNSDIRLILGLALGCGTFICLIVLGIAVRRRRAGQEAAQPKERRDDFIGFRPLSNTNELRTYSPNSVHGSDESGNFMYVKAQRSPMDMPRASSLSYNPYLRTSFVEAGNEVSSYSLSFSDSEPPCPSSIERTSPSQPSTAKDQF